MTILALDLGTKTGWAFWDGRRRESGVQLFDVKRGESPGMRYLRFNAWLGFWIADGRRPELVVYEAAHHRGGAATEIAAGFATRVQEFCAAHGIEHAAVHSGTLKKFATGRGNAKKPEMILAVQQRFGYAGGDEDEADTICLLEYARAELIVMPSASGGAVNRGRA